MKASKYIIIPIILIALSIAFGAFGAHMLNPGLENKYIGTLGTANQYFIVISVALLSLGILIEKNIDLKKPYWMILLGVILFSGSLYIIVLCKYFENQVPSFVGPLTPIGGLFMIVGWCWCAYKIFHS